MSAITAESIMNNIKRTLEPDAGGAGGGPPGLDEAEKRFYGVTVGWVTQPLDPMTLGRLQVRLPAIDSMDLARSARVAVPMAGFEHGHYFIPNVGDEVLVAFEHGDINAPIIIGSLWNALAPPPLPSPLAQIRAIRTLAGNQIVMAEAPPTIAIQTAPTPPVAMPAPPSPTGPHQTVMLGPAGIQAMTPISVQLNVGTNTITITPTNIILQAGGNGITISSAGIEIMGTNVNLMAAGNVSINGALVRINS